ncbi:MAG: thiamine-phosphate kinase [Clostridia bacterium]|nr:thiamine-phosphate kinase [Clostridia bacterium]
MCYTEVDALLKYAQGTFKQKEIEERRLLEEVVIKGGEFGLIKRIREQMGSKIGDDAAILQPPKGKLLASIDMLVEGIHFEKSYITPWQLGWKALAVNISDIAAMGGTPLYALVSLGLSHDIDDAYVDEIYQGLAAVASRFGVKVVGGDIVKSPGPLVVDVAILGESDHPVTRSGARPGDLIGVTGYLGSSAAGLAWLQSQARPARPSPIGSPTPVSTPPWAQELVRAHLEPIPRVEEGRQLAATGAVSAMMDISDGLASEINHIAEEGQVGAILYGEDVPISQATLAAAEALGADPLSWALFGGEDYQLVFTFAPEARACISKALKRLESRFWVVGKILPQEQGIRLVRRDGSAEQLLPQGYNHFRSD